MRKRLLFHLFHFLVFNVLIFAAVYIYYAINYPAKYITYSVVTAYNFVLDHPVNFILVSVLTYFLSYVTNLLKYTLDEKGFRLAAYLRELFKFFLILAMTSFMEFFLFYNARIGRVIYVILLGLYGIYYLVYLAVRSETGPQDLVWRAAVPVEEIFAKYIRKPSAFRILKEDEPETPGASAHVIYQDSHIDEHFSEALIKDKLAGRGVMELVELVEREAGKIPMDYVNIHWFLAKFEVVNRYYFRLSRVFDLFMSFLLLVLLFPPGLLLALVHKIFSKGPVFFIQERAGLHGKVFKLIKFRTMVNEAETEGARFAGKNDPRITRIGKIMRRFRIDEVPQFLNVLKGEMSLVGPRPEREVFIDSLSRDLPYYKLRLLVPPGLTGWAQVHGVYAGSLLEDHKVKLEFDLYYIKNRSIFMDLMILLITIKTIILARGE
ncbi:MAG: sugar transferase [bacterium]|nr:sugar transferase [bacterium]